MPRFRKKPSSSERPTNESPSTPTPPIVEYIKKELATFYPQVKDKRALAASSSAIALSIAFPACDPTDLAPEESSSSRESVWKAAYGAARMAIDTAKESSDVFPPLKAVAGALSFLIKNYDVSHSEHLVLLTADRILQQTTTNVEQIKDIEERIQLLAEVLASPVGDKDTEEKTRRQTLIKFVPPSPGDIFAFLNHLYRLQEVGWDRYQTQAAVRTTWAREVPEERRRLHYTERLSPGAG